MNRALGCGALLWALGWCGCSSTAWDRHDESLYLTLQDPGPKSFAGHAELLKQTIDQAEARQARPPAGVCAEYAYYVARLGRVEEARLFVAKEQGYYPEAATFLATFGRYLEGVSAVEAPATSSGSDGGGS